MTDASRKSSADKAGVGWSLHSRQGTLQIQESAAIQPTISRLVAEAWAMLLVVQQMIRLYYKKVMLITDCQALLRRLRQVQQWSDHKRRVLDINDAMPIIHDIWNLAKNNDFKFSYVSRACTHNLANKVRISNQSYVIFWSLCLLGLCYQH